MEKASRDSLSVRLDDGRKVDVDLKTHGHVEHGYAATVHKTQGMTVDHTHVLATPGMDAHSTYVALSRHREGITVHYGRDDFADETQLRHTLARERPKDMALDQKPEPGQSAHDGRRDSPIGPPPSRLVTARQIATGQPGAATTQDNATTGKENAGPACGIEQDRAQKLRETFAALAKTPHRTSEQARAAFAAAAKVAPSASRDRDRDRGAER